MRRRQHVLFIAALARYIGAEETCVNHSINLAIPAVDLEGLSKASAIVDTRNSIVDACESFGLFRLVGHGISQGTIDGALAAHQKLFSLPSNEKSSVPIEPGGFTRGYIPLGSESGSASRLECKEAFSYGFEWAAQLGKEQRTFKNPLQGENVWPAVLDQSVRLQLTTFFDESVRVSRLIASSLSGALGMSPSALDELCEGGDTISLMRLFRYFPEADPRCKSAVTSIDERIGSSPHTDWVESAFLF